MSTDIVPKPLNLKGTTIAYPVVNHASHPDPKMRLLVTITEIDCEPEAYSLYYCYCQYYPQIHQYLKKIKNGPLHEDIVDYYNAIIETPINYEYEEDTWGYVTTGSTLETSFGKIKSQSKYETEIFLLHDELQKYEFEHYDITSPIPKKLTKNDIQSPIGWITESVFTPAAIDPELYEEDDWHIVRLKYLYLLQWKACREEYLLKKLVEQKCDLDEKIEARGELFRSTYLQWQQPINKALRGKINVNNVSKRAMVKYNTPRNLWIYYIEPVTEDTFRLDDDEELQFNNNVCCLEYETIDACQIIPWQYLIKLYDQNGQAFRIDKSIPIDVNNFDGFEEVIDVLIKQINKKALNKYKKEKKDKKNKFAIKRQVKYYVTINGLQMEYNKNTGRTVLESPVYKVTKLSNGNSLVSGKYEL